ncbi:DUF6207 family protein [Streptomyces griseus]|uniref:DUF6207 family protein n=1 Tax=Streptomyces griseus TaxID=1911 RepID=UPI002D21A7A6|nr:DUF6207 family protein [Streptomyces griseus]
MSRPTGGTAGSGEIRRGRWATATSNRTRQDPRQPRVRLRCLDLRQELSTQPPARCCSALPAMVGSAAGGHAHSVCRRADWVEGMGCDADTAKTDARRPRVRPRAARGAGR